jgi:hypothetical protein
MKCNEMKRCNETEDLPMSLNPSLLSLVREDGPASLSVRLLRIHIPGEPARAARHSFHCAC